MTTQAMMLRELRALYRVSQAITASLDLRDVVCPVLQVLAEELGMQRGTLALVDPETGELAIEEAHGLTAAEKRRGRYRIGEGVMGRVLETGEPMAIPSVGAEPLFLDRTGARRDADRLQIAFLCVPVKLGEETVGVLSADRLSGHRVDLEEDLRLLSIVAGVVAQAVRVQQMLRREKADLVKENEQLRCTLRGELDVDNLVGESRVMQAVRAQVAIAAKRSVPVLITGETGTGKQRVARAVHFSGPGAGRPFREVPCGALGEPLLEEALFGGAAGGGALEEARGGTLVLQRVDALPPDLQARLHRRLLEVSAGAARGVRDQHEGVRLIATTERDLAAAARSGVFHPELHHHLNLLPIHLPPLRDRKEDIPLLAQHFLDGAAPEGGQGRLSFAADALRRLGDYGWPGNVAELESAVTLAAAGARGRRLEVDDLPPGLQAVTTRVDHPWELLERALAQLAADACAAEKAPGLLPRVVRRAEEVLIGRCLEHCGGVRLRAAQVLGMSRNTLQAKLAREEEEIQ